MYFLDTWVFLFLLWKVTIFFVDKNFISLIFTHYNKYVVLWPKLIYYHLFLIINNLLDLKFMHLEIYLFFFFQNLMGFYFGEVIHLIHLRWWATVIHKVSTYSSNPWVFFMFLRIYRNFVFSKKVLKIPDYMNCKKFGGRWS